MKLYILPNINFSNNLLYIGKSDIGLYFWQSKGSSFFKNRNNFSYFTWIGKFSIWKG